MRATKALVLLTLLAVGLLWIAGLIDSPSEANAATVTSAKARSYDFRAERLADRYDRWKRAAHADPARYEVTIPLAWFPGVSSERSQARGLAFVDMNAGTVSVELGGMDLPSLTDVWLVDNRPGPGATAMPDENDATRRIGSLRVDEAGVGTLRTHLGPTTFRNFDVDRVVIARRGEGPIRGGVLYGAPTMFERLHRVSWRVQQGLAPVAGDESSRQGMLSRFAADSASASEDALELLGALVDEGEDLFNNETFDGNGRTCATCHPAINNFTLDKEFIASLPPDDPLFVAEVIPDLNHELNGGLFFENPVLMREFGLIVENVDGFDDLANKFVMRSVNHLFALALTIEPSETNQCETIPPLHRVGWSGDGASGSGNLREFSIDAVIQHTPLTLNRIDGVDFRLPTDEELDALEAFQLTLGRTEDIDLRRMEFVSTSVSRGRDVFVQANLGRCNGCHGNAGAMRIDPLTPNLRNHNFDIGIGQVEHPAAVLGEPMPFDDGFSPHPDLPRCRVTFSTPSLIEAADTAPFEHNNVFATLEEAIGHYSTEEFNEGSTAGQRMVNTPAGPIDLSEEQVSQIGSMLRVLNSLHNIDEVTKCDTRAISMADLGESADLLRICAADNQDAIDVLSEGPVAPIHPSAINHLRASLQLQKDAARAATTEDRDAALNAAVAEMVLARAEMVIDEP